MAARFWVGGTGNWDATTTTNWSATTGGAGGESVPGASDTVTFDASSDGGTITLTYSPSVVSITGGAHTGTFNTGNNNITVQTFSYTGTGARTLTLGSSTITVTGNNATIITFATITSLTLSANTAIFNCTYSGGTGTRTIDMGAVGETACINLSVSAGTDALIISAASNVKNLNLTGYSGTKSNTTTTIFGNLTVEGAATYTAGTSAWTFAATSGTKTITSDSETLDFPLTFNGVGGTWQLADNLTVGSTRTTTLTNGTFDINGKAFSTGLFVSSNTNIRVLEDVATGGSITLTGNNVTIWSCSDLTNFTFITLPVITSNYSGATGTRTFANGATNGTEANSQSFNITAGTDIVTLQNTGKFGSIDFTGFSGSLLMTFVRTIYGSLTLSSTMTTGSSTTVTTLGATSGTKTITTNGVTINGHITINGLGGTFQLGSDLTLAATNRLTITNGTFTCINGANNYILSTGLFTMGGGTTTLGSATHLITGTGTTTWNVTGGTLTAFTGTIKITDTSNTAITFVGGGKTTYNNVWFSRGASTATNTITGTNTFADFKDDGTAAHTIVFPNVTTTVTSFTVSGTLGNVITLSRTGASGTWTISDGSGTNTVSYLSISNSAATGGATWDASDGTNTDGGGNSGWDFGSDIKTINGLAKASVKTVNGLAIASVKTFNGLA